MQRLENKIMIEYTTSLCYIQNFTLWTNSDIKIFYAAEIPTQNVKPGALFPPSFLDHILKKKVFVAVAGNQFICLCASS